MTTAIENLESMTVQEFNSHVGKIIKTLPADLADDWLSDLDEFWDIRSDEEREEDQKVLRRAFWDAARTVIGGLLLHGHQILDSEQQKPQRKD